MAEPEPRNSYEIQFNEAKAHYEAEEFEKCVREAKHNLNDPTLPIYYTITNCILLVYTLDTWKEAEVYRLAAEQAWSTGKAKAERIDDRTSLAMLVKLRSTLDRLLEMKKEDLGDEEIVLLDDDEGFWEDEDGEDVEETSGGEEDKPALTELEEDEDEQALPAGGCPIESPLRSPCRHQGGI